jgi:hypothetical protein
VCGDREAPPLTDDHGHAALLCGLLWWLLLLRLLLLLLLAAHEVPQALRQPAAQRGRHDHHPALVAHTVGCCQQQAATARQQAADNAGARRQQRSSAPEVWPRPRLGVQRQRQRGVSVERALVELIQHHHAHAAQRGVLLQTPQQDALGDDLDARRSADLRHTRARARANTAWAPQQRTLVAALPAGPCNNNNNNNNNNTTTTTAHPALQPHAVAHGAPHGLSQQRGHAPRSSLGRHAPRLQHLGVSCAAAQRGKQQAVGAHRRVQCASARTCVAPATPPALTMMAWPFAR